MESFITNEFARLLVFYENIKRSKLNENDLNKVNIFFILVILSYLFLS